MSDCKCDELTRDGTFPLLLPHVPTCPEFGGCVQDMIMGLVRGMEAWASDEDGIHPDAWQWYERAKIAIGEPVE